MLADRIMAKEKNCSERNEGEPATQFPCVYIVNKKNKNREQSICVNIVKIVVKPALWEQIVNTRLANIFVKLL